MSRYRRRRGMGNEDVISLIIGAALVVFLMPFAGLFFLLKKDRSMRWLGWVLLILGIIIWIVIGATI